MVDVAQMAGVSQQTVSRVVAGHKSVRDSTREKVLLAISALKYKPNYAAQLLASGTSRSVGVITVGPMLEGFGATFISLERVLRTYGRYVLSASAPDESLNSVLEALAYLHSQCVTAIVVVCQNRKVPSVIAEHTEVPLILVMSGKPKVPGVTTVSLSQSRGAREVTEHLLSSGYKKVVHVAGNLQHEDAALRAKVFSRVCDENGIIGEVIKADGWSAEKGYDAAGRYLKNNEMPQAVFAANDYLAIGVMRAFLDAGYTAGKDYALAGFDNTAICDYISPRITSVHQDYDAIALTITEQIEQIALGAPVSDVEIPSRLVVRGSSIILPI